MINSSKSFSKEKGYKKIIWQAHKRKKFFADTSNDDADKDLRFYNNNLHRKSVILELDLKESLGGFIIVETSFC